MNVLIYGDTTTSAAMRHEIPLGIGDPFLYMESDGHRAVLTNALEEARIAQAAPDVERLLGDALGRDALIAAGYSRTDVNLELCARAVAAMSFREAVVPPEFPLALADRLRADGVQLTPDEALFSERRRRKTERELAGIRRAAGAAVEAMLEGASMIREAEVRGDELWHGGEHLTSETVRGRIREVSGRLGAPAPADIMVKAMGQDPRIGHYPGSGPLPANTPILIDLWPRDEESGCWADMTRTFVRGEVSDGVGELHELVMNAQRSVGGVRVEDLLVVTEQGSENLTGTVGHQLPV